MFQAQAGSTLLEAMGEWTIGYGKPKRSANIGAGKINGYNEVPQVAFIEGEITDSSTLDIPKLLLLTGATVTVRLGVGKTVMLQNAWQAGEGTYNATTGGLVVRFESESELQTV